MLGYALGCIHLSYDDFCRCTFDEFESICRAYNDQRSADYKDGWERMRMLATLTIQPHLKKKITPKQLLKFDWDKKRKKDKEKELTPEQQRERFKELVEKFGENY